MEAVTARPASLRHYHRVATDASEELRTISADLDATLEAAVAGARDISLQLPPHASEVRGLAAGLDELGHETARLAAALESLDRGGGPVIETTEAQLATRLGPSSFDRAEAVLSHIATRGFLNGYGLLRLSQRARALVGMTSAWVRRETLTALTSFRATGAMLWRFATLRWTSMTAAGDRVWGRAAPRIAHHTARIDDAREVFVHGRGVLRTVGRFAAPVAVAADGHTLVNGSRYDGVRGHVDRGMAGVGVASGVALGGVAVLVGLGVITAAPVVVTVAAIGATAAAAWGVLNFAWDHRSTIGNAVSDAASWTRDRVQDTASAVAETASSVASSVADGVSGAASSVRDGVSDGLRSAGRVLGFGG